MIVEKEQLKEAADALSEEERGVLERTAERIRVFAQAQRDAISEITIPIPGGVAGHNVAPVERAGCYAPGGRYPLPSSVLMTAVTARVAGCKQVIVASPHPTTATLAAAHIAGADKLLCVGGAQAIAALAYGAGELFDACDAVCGPGNKFVTAAKSLVAGRVAIDMLAGPSECLVLADASADPAVVAADLLAQAEHDVMAVPELVTTSEELVGKVEGEIARQLATLETADVASVAVRKNAWVCVCPDMESAIAVCNSAAPEHLEVHTEDADEVAKKLEHYGGLFIGANCAEVVGDYGAGPNHTLPTGGTARCSAGLSVFTFLRIRTWMRIDNLGDAQGLMQDAAALGHMEGLKGHARAADLRITK
eukprot:TRINITY_DN5817_c0_g1_i2.p1 TRINITY_DN5817_c0_g1~~TRINITY_DN5817_c0_g1_i2.p1  ORF type:complete len:365 (-),score=120.40 TRINITY_DN5817_c0_g1_i2:236-1330(-)